MLDSKFLYELEETNEIILGRGQIISDKDLKKTPGDYPVYSSSAKLNGELGRYGKYMFDDERITWSIDGGGRLFYRDKHKYSVTNVCGWIKINSSSLLTKYVYYNLYTQWRNKVFDYTYKAHPSVIRKVYKIKITTIDKQKIIVNELESIENTINQIEKLLPLYEELIKSRFIGQEVSA